MHLDGETAPLLLGAGSAVAGRKVTTIEGLARPPRQAVQKAWVDLDVRAMRLLPVGTDHVGHRAAREETPADRRRHRPRDGRQSLPLRDVPPHPRRHPCRGQDAPGGRHDARQTGLEPDCATVSSSFAIAACEAPVRPPVAASCCRRWPAPAWCLASAASRQVSQAAAPGAEGRPPAVALNAVRADRHGQPRHRHLQAPRDGPGHHHRALDAGRRGARCGVDADAHGNLRPPTPHWYANPALGRCKARAARARSRTRDAVRQGGRRRPRDARGRPLPSGWDVAPGSITVCRRRARATPGGPPRPSATSPPRPAGRRPAGQPTLKDPATSSFDREAWLAPRLDVVAKTNGTAIYTIDLTRPGMLTAVVAHVRRNSARSGIIRREQGARGCRASSTWCRSQLASRCSPKGTGTRSRAAKR